METVLVCIFKNTKQGNKRNRIPQILQKQTLSKVLAWYDTQILQQIGIASKTTLEVRIRIVCGMVNKLPIEVLTRDLKIEFMECIWDTFRKFYDEWNEWYCRYILQLPF